MLGWRSADPPLLENFIWLTVKSFIFRSKINSNPPSLFHFKKVPNPCYLWELILALGIILFPFGFENHLNFLFFPKLRDVTQIRYSPQHIHYKQYMYCSIDQGYKFSNLKRTVVHYCIHYHCLINKLYNFNTLEKYVEIMVIIDLSAIKIIYGNIDFLLRNWKFEFIKLKFCIKVFRSFKTSFWAHTIQLWNSSPTSPRLQKLPRRFSLWIFEYLPDSTGRLLADSRNFDTATLCTATICNLW